MPLIGQLGDLERAVMEALWDSPEPLSGRSVHEALEDRSLAYTTVMTVLSRLTTKEFVVRERVRAAWVYAAAATRQELTAEALQATLSDLPRDERRTALVHFIDAADADDLKALRAALDRIAPSD